MPRFTLKQVFSSSKLKSFLWFDAGIGREIPHDLRQRPEQLADNLNKARNTVQKQGQRISNLRSEISELEPAHPEEKRMLHYLLSDAFERHGPWVTGVKIGGQHYGKGLRHHDPRLSQFYAVFPEASRGRILETGSLEGALTIELAKRASRVVGIEARPTSVERAEFLKALFSAENATFYTANLEEDDLTSYGTFDAIFCCGLLYHLPYPRRLMERMAAVSPNLYLDTHYAPNDDPEWGLVERDGLKGWVRQERGWSKPRSGVSETAFWPTLEELERLLSTSGYTSFERLMVRPDNRNGPRVRIAASQR